MSYPKRPIGNDVVLRSYFVIFALAIPAVVLHEVGHIVGGWLVGFRFNTLLIGPMRLSMRQGRLRVMWHRKLGFGGGFTAVIPPDNRDLGRRMGIVIACGPLFSLAMGLGGSLMWWLVPQDLPSWRATVGIAAVWGFITFVISAKPASPAGFLTDGAILLLLARGGPNANRYIHILALYSEAASGEKRPRDWNTGWIGEATSLPDDSFHHTVGCMTAYYHALDCGNVRTAGNWLDMALARVEKFPAPFRSSIYLEAAGFTALTRKDSSYARTLFTKGLGGVVDTYVRLTAEAAVLFSEDRFDESLEKANAGLKEIDRAADPGSKVVGRDRLAWIVRACENQLHTSEPVSALV